MERIKSAFIASRSYFTAALTVLALASSSYGNLTYYTDFTSFDAVTDTTVWEDFRSGPIQGVFSFTHNGITYTGLQPICDNVCVVSSDLNEDMFLTAGGDEDFAVDFGSPSTAVGFDTYLNLYGPAIIEIHGSSGLLDTYNHSHDPSVVGFFGVVSDDPIYRIRWTTTLGRVVNTGITNIRLPGSPPGPCEVIPAPGAVVLGIIGVGFVSWLRRRRAL